MIYLVVGHSGTGKTAFVQRARSYYQERAQAATTWDLDRVIEDSEGLAVEKLFLNLGEEKFRELENQALHKLVRANENHPGAVFIAVGAGYRGAWPSGTQVIWVRRLTDRQGRIFLDRPLADDRLTPLADFLNSYDRREETFRSVYDTEVMVGEGWDFTNPYEPALLGLKPAAAGFSVTVLPEHLETENRLSLFLREALLLGARYVEFRDDLLGVEEIQRVAKQVPFEKVLISFRERESSVELQKFAGPYATDWNVANGPSPFAHNSFVSLHERLDGESIEEAAERLLSVRAEHHRLNIPVEDFVELWAGHRFYVDDRERRSFHPRSPSGRWRWYRLLQNRDMKLNFARRGDGASLDEPLYFDFLRYPSRTRGFSAVLGHPVEQSRTVAEHSEFFAARQMGVVAVSMSEDECHSLNFSILERLGMRAAAVLSPLKKRVMDICAHVDRRASELTAVNTIVHAPGGWNGVNTDLTGMQKLLATVELPEDVVVWGGAGTRHLLRSLLPHARFYSARRGEQIWLDTSRLISPPEVVIWAVGRARQEGLCTPPSDWRPKYIMDLNYTQDSPGLEYARSVGAKYISGRGLFKNQAQAQREFWARSSFL